MARVGFVDDEVVLVFPQSTGVQCSVIQRGKHTEFGCFPSLPQALTQAVSLGFKPTRWAHSKCDAENGMSYPVPGGISHLLEAQP